MAARKSKRSIESTHKLPFQLGGKIDFNLRTEKVDTWPASSSSTPTITTNKSLAFLKSQQEPKHVMKNLMSNISACNKPLLLIQLEEFIEFELNRPVNQYANVEDINESRLDVFRECFDTFISHFQTYQPVLMQIKHGYDEFIARCLKKVHHVNMIQTKYNTLEKESNAKIEALKKEQQRELQQRDDKIDELFSHINDMKIKHENVDQLLSDAEAKHKELTEQLNDSQRSAKTFYQEIKRIESTLAHTETLKESAEAELRSLQIEHQKVSIAYDSVVNDLKRLQEEVDKGPAISSKQVEEKDKKIRFLQEKVNEYKQLYQSLMDDHQNVLDLYQAVTKERQQQAQQYAALTQHEDGSRPVTPRPHWDKAVELNFMKSESIDGKSTDDIVAFMTTTLKQLEKKVEMLQSVVSDDQLKELEIKDASLYMEVDYDNNTPKYLRYRGKIRKRRMPKRDLEKLLSGIWSKKYSSKTTEKMPLQDYLYDYFKCEYGIQSRVVETGYSMLAALERYRYDADCELFLTILNGELSEDVYRDQTQFIQSIHTEFKNVDSKKNSKISGVLAKRDIQQIIRKMCPAKDPQNMKKLVNALDLNEPHDMVRYELLFIEDRDGNQGPWLEELRDQHLGEIQDFLNEIKQSLQSVMNQYQQVTVQQIEDMYKTLDPCKPQSELNKYVCAGFGVSMIKSLGKDLLISVDTYFKRLSTILVKRTGLQNPENTAAPRKSIHIAKMQNIVHQLTTQRQSVVAT